MQAPVGEDGYFGPGALVPEFSSPGRDTRIFIRRDGLEVFITSDRTGGQGLIDIWTSTRDTLSDPWSTPVDLPVPSTAPPTMALPGFHGTEQRCISSQRVPSVMG